MKEKKILTLHPQGKSGVNISLEKYEQIKVFILETLAAKPDLLLDDLFDLAEQELSQTFDGKIGWYVMSVKLDLEARGIIERVPKASPQRLRLHS